MSDHVLRKGSPRLVRNLASASKGDMHVCAGPWVRYFGRLCRGKFRRAGARVGALAALLNLSLYALYWSAKEVVLNHVWSQ